jgi:hypothetical protein
VITRFQIWTSIRIFYFIVCCWKYGNKNVWTCSSACCLVQMWNVVFHFMGEHRLKVFQNKVLRSKFWSHRFELTWKWRKLENGKCHSLCYFLHNIVKTRWTHARFEVTEVALNVLFRQPHGKRSFWMSVRGPEDDIRMSLGMKQAKHWFVHVLQYVLLTSELWIPIGVRTKKYQ